MSAPTTTGLSDKELRHDRSGCPVAGSAQWSEFRSRAVAAREPSNARARLLGEIVVRPTRQR